MKQVVRIFGIFVTTMILGATAGLTSDLSDCPTSGYLNNCFGTFNYSGDEYTGEFQDNKRHGYGTYTFLNGGSYTGYWANDMRNGFGTNIWNDGEKYTGDYKDDLRHGFGVNYFPNGQTFEGWFENGFKNGIGIISFAGEYKGDKYIGYNLNDDMSGQGLYIWDDGRSDLCFYEKNKPSNCSGTNINNVFPILKRSYTALNVKDRKIIQQILNEKGRYNDTIDGKWGKNTLIAIAEFAAIEMATIDLQKPNIVENILGGILQAGLNQSNTTQKNNTASIAPNLPACPTSGYLNNCFGTYTYANGDQYVGEFKNDAMNGQGTYTFGPNSEWAGDQYEGEFKNDAMNGQGTYTFSPNSEWAGDQYKGEYKNNKWDGQGTYTYANGDQYVGEFKNDAANGQGAYTSANGDRYVGEHKNNKRDGQGTYTFGPNSEWAGDQYKGEFKDGTYNGQGTYTYANGDQYKGEFKNGTYNGQGTYTYANGDQYVGEFKNYKRDGQGTFTYANGAKLEGVWREDEFLNERESIPKEPENNSIANNIDPNETLNAASDTDLPACPTSGTFNNCFGSYTFDNGDKYVGEFNNDAFNGQGTYTFGPNSEWAGDKHVGEYKNNKRNGQGTYTHSNGDKYVGEYKNDMMSGQGTYTFANGNKYVGEYKNDVMSGQGIYTFANGNEYIGEFKNGAYNGHGTFTYANGDKYVGELKNNKRNGQGTFTYANGEEMEGVWRDDEFLYADKNTPKEPKNKSIADNIDPNEILNAASGTGFYVSNEGHIITNHHVINGCSEIKVLAEGKSTTATILAKDASNDLALLKISNRPPHVFAFSNENPYPLQNIIVAGFPFGDAVSSSLKFTTGVISSLAGIGNNYSQIQIDAALQPGNSGGPIIDELGNIVGIAVAKLDVDKVYEDFGVIPENTNFGIKGSIAKILLQSFNVPLKAPNKNEIPKSELSKITTKGTLHLSCWMTLAQIEKMQSQKVLFENFD